MLLNHMKIYDEYYNYGYDQYYYNNNYDENELENALFINNDNLYDMQWSIL